MAEFVTDIVPAVGGPADERELLGNEHSFGDRLHPDLELRPLSRHVHDVLAADVGADALVIGECERAELHACAGLASVVHRVRHDDRRDAGLLEDELLVEW